MASQGMFNPPFPLVMPVFKENVRTLPVIPVLEGSLPGQLDPGQRNRVLREPSSTLSFAWFDPNTASPFTVSRLGNLSLDEGCRPQRIVIETRPGVGSSWRWVPRARLRSHVQGEGTFPRVVQVCGELYTISQEQWDIYKLDPLYDCFVDDFSLLSIISRKPYPSYGNDRSSVWSDPTNSQNPSNTKDSDDMMEVDDDNNNSQRRRSPPYAFDFSTTPPITSPPSSHKRNAFVSFQNLRDPEEEENAYFEKDNQTRNTKQFIPKITKRARTMSPLTSQRAARSHFTKRNFKKLEDIAIYKAECIFDRNIKMESDLLAHIPKDAYAGNNFNSEVVVEEEDIDAEIRDASPEPEATEEGVSEADRIAESLRKMMELNQDRHHQRELEKVSQEEVAKGKRSKSQAPSPEEERRRRAEADRQKAEEERQARLLREENHRQAAWARYERLRKWDENPWDETHAINRFEEACEFTDKANFSAERFPLTWMDIPWPTLRHPRQTTTEDIDWDTVSRFFDTLRAKRAKSNVQYAKVLKKNAFRFHPDRWVNSIKAIIDDRERHEVEAVLTIVSQAINSLKNELNE